MGQVFCCVRVNMATVEIKDQGLGQVFCFVDVEYSKVTIKEELPEPDDDDLTKPGGCKCMSWIFAAKIAGVQVRCAARTKDDIPVVVVANVQYRVSACKARGARKKQSDTRSQIQASVLDVIGATVPKLSLDDALEQKNEIAKAVEEELKKAMSAYGYKNVKALIVDIKPDDEHAKRPMNETNAGLRVAAKEKAEAEKILQIKPVEEDVEPKYLSGFGVGR